MLPRYLVVLYIAISITRVAVVIPVLNIVHVYNTRVLLMCHSTYFNIEYCNIENYHDTRVHVRSVSIMLLNWIWPYSIPVLIIAIWHTYTVRSMSGSTFHNGTTRTYPVIRSIGNNKVGVPQHPSARVLLMFLCRKEYRSRLRKKKEWAKKKGIQRD